MRKALASATLLASLAPAAQAAPLLSTEPPAPRCAGAIWADGRLHEGPPNFGCATRNALAAMIADPQDLDRGRTATATPAEAAAQAVERLQKGAAKGLAADAAPAGPALLVRDERAPK